MRKGDLHAIVVDHDNPNDHWEYVRRVGELQGKGIVEHTLRFRRRFNSNEERQRSIQQNRLYFGVIVQEMIEGMREEWAETWGSNEEAKEDAHECLASEYSGCFVPQADPETGEIVMVRKRKRTSRMTVAEFSDYMEWCVEFIDKWFHRKVKLGPESEWRWDSARDEGRQG